MRKAFLIAGLIFAAGSAWAGPTGTWRVTDNTADIEIVPCGAALCGIVARTDKPDQRDAKNPDASKRNQPVLGMTVLQNMRAQGDKWVGTVYNTRDGHTYDAKISMRGEDILRLEGCLPGGVICGGQNWSRIAQPSVAAAVPPQAEVKEASPDSPAPLQSQQPRAPATFSDQQQDPGASQVAENTSRSASPLDLNLSHITPGQAADVGRTAAGFLNQILDQRRFKGPRIDPDQAALAARSATKIIKSM